MAGPTLEMFQILHMTQPRTGVIKVDFPNFSEKYFQPDSFSDSGCKWDLNQEHI